VQTKLSAGTWLKWFNWDHPKIKWKGEKKGFKKNLGLELFGD
jgi:hypothetical protein